MAGRTTPRGGGSRGTGDPPASTVAAWVAEPPTGDEDDIRYGPGVPGEATVRLLGQVSGKRVVLLGSGRGGLLTRLASRGAKVICLEPDEALLAEARQHGRDAGLNVEIYARDFAELASIRADTVDLVLSVLELAGVADLTRVFRQVHRVLRPEATLLLSLPHPSRLVAAGATFPVAWAAHGHRGLDHGHSVEDVFTALVRTGFRVDNLLELHDGEPDPFPAVLLLRARRQGAHASAS